jgi:hypothetical protein
VRRTFSLVDVALAGIVAVFVVFATHTSADPDLWGHLRFGSDVLAAHHLQQWDQYSFTSDIAWINHEWLAELVFAILYALAGSIGLNLLKLAVIGAIAALLWRQARRLDATAFSSILLTILVCFVTYTRTQVLRPQLFSVLFFCLLLLIIVDIERNGRERIWALPLLFCVWANTHGAWIVGLGTLTMWSVCWTLEHRRLDCVVRRMSVVLAATAATIVNPYGIGLWTFLHDTVGLSRPDIVDWNPFLKFPPEIIGLELVLPLLAIVAAGRTRQLPRIRHLAVIVMLAAATYRVGRIDAFLQLAIAIFCMPSIVTMLNGVDASLRRRERLRHESYAHAIAIAGLAIAATGVAVARLDRVFIEGTWVPDREAISVIQREAAHKRLLTWFDWGEYAIWHVADADIRVSMDGRRETVYSDRVIRDHFAFYGNTTPDAWRYADAIGADRIWLPTKLPIVGPLREHGWRPIFESRTSVILARDDQIPPTTPRVVAVSDRMPARFPGP